MPAPTNQLKRTAIYVDGETLLVSPRVSITATTAGNAVEFPAIAQGTYKAVVSYDAITGYVAGTAFWTLNLQVATTNAGPWTTVASAPLEAQGLTEAVTSGREVQQSAPDAAFVRAELALTGGAGALNHEVFLSPTCHGG